LIFLTGDVHNFLGWRLDQAHGRVDEPAAATEVARLAADAGLKLTYFATGRAIIEEPAKYRAIAALGNVELGGHGWDSFKNRNMRTALWCLFGSRYGPRPYQKHELDKTVRAFRRHLGFVPKVWRGHAFYADENTYPLLSAAGVRVVSDHVITDREARASIGEIMPGLASVPINILPDHDSVVHGSITESSFHEGMPYFQAIRDLCDHPSLSRNQRLAISTRRAFRHLFDVRVMAHSGELLYASARIEVLPPREWEMRLLAQIEERVATDGFATLLLHPLCMSALDGLAALRRILAFCRRFETRFVSEAAAMAGNAGAASP